MIIRVLQGYFGILNNEKLYLKPGLNIIKLNNEGGKSTLANFIRLMFYGIDTSKRDRKNILADKTKYKPLSDKPMSGIMEIEFNDESLIIERNSGKAGAFSEFNCFDKNTGANKYSQNTFKAQVLGIGESEFINCAFIDGCDMSILSADILEQKILALSSTGDNTMGTAKALERLSRMRLDIRANSSKGYLPENLEALSLVNDKITDYNNIKNELNRIDILTTKKLIYKKQQEKENLLMQNKKSDDEIAFENLEAELKLLRKPTPFDINIIEKYMRANESLLEIHREYEKDLEAYTNEQNIKLEFSDKILKKKKIHLSFILISIIIAVISTVYSQIIVAIVLLLIALFTAINTPKNNFIEKYEKPDEHRLNKARLLEKNIKDEIFRICVGIEDIDLAIIQIKEMQKYAWEYNIKVKTRNDLYTRIKNNKTQVDLEKNINNLNGEIKNLEIEYENIFKYKNSLEEKINTLGALEKLLEEKTKIEKEVQKLENKLKAIQLAVEVINSANEELSARMAPEISRLCSEYFARITGDKHNKVILRRSFELFSSKETGLLDTIRMSTGTREQLYLALRLCICKILTGNNIPIILDDPFMSFDDERIANTMQLLREIAVDRQIIIFTARDVGGDV